MKNKKIIFLLIFVIFANNFLLSQGNLLSPKSSIAEEINKIKKISGMMAALTEIPNADKLIKKLPEEDEEIVELRKIAHKEYFKKVRTKKEQIIYKNALETLGDRGIYRPYRVLDLSKQVVAEIGVESFPQEIYSLTPAEFEAFAKRIVTNQVLKFVQKGIVSNQQEYYSIIETCVSRLLMKKIDKDCISKKKISYLIPLWNEVERLKKPAEAFTGEDFLNVKAEQLEFLYAGIKNVDYEILIMFDRKFPKEEDKARNVIDMVPLLEKAANGNPKIIITDTFSVSANFRKGLRMDNSRKGGAVHVGMRYIAEERLDVTDVYYTDADISVNPGNTGILLYKNFYDKQDVVIGARTMSDSHVFGKTGVRKFLSLGFNVMTRALFLVNISDTQVGAKLIKLRPHFVKIQGECTEVSMSFDPQLLKLMELDGANIVEMGIVWIDSAILSQSAGLAKRMFWDSTRMWSEMYPTWKQYLTNIRLDIVWGMVTNFMPNVWSSSSLDPNIIKLRLLSIMPTMA